MTDAQKLLQQAHTVIQGFNTIIDQVLPQAGKLVIDVGLLNDTLVAASAFMREYAEPRSSTTVFVVGDEFGSTFGIFATLEAAKEAYPSSYYFIAEEKVLCPTPPSR